MQPASSFAAVTSEPRKGDSPRRLPRWPSRKPGDGGTPDRVHVETWDSREEDEERQWENVARALVLRRRGT